MNEKSSKEISIEIHEEKGREDLRCHREVATRRRYDQQRDRLHDISIYYVPHDLISLLNSRSECFLDLAEILL